MASEPNARPKAPQATNGKLSGTRPRAPLHEARMPVGDILPPPPLAAERATVVEPPVDFEAHDTIPAPPWLDDEHS